MHSGERQKFPLLVHILKSNFTPYVPIQEAFFVPFLAPMHIGKALYYLPNTHTHYQQVSYPNFIWGPLFVDMRLLLDHLKMFNTHRCGIHKVLRCFEKKPVKNTKTGVYLAKWGVCK